MTKSEWKELIESKELLGLGESATLGEIKRSYRQRCKEYHPDIVGDDKAKGDMMRKLTRAYDVLLNYSKQFKIPLIPQSGEAVEVEDWWMHRFGRDPLWGKNSV
jgi:hypothetical protein